MSSFRILKQVPQDKLGNVVPPAYRGIAPRPSGEDTTLTVILFRHDARSVISSATVEKALRRLGEGENGAVAVGGNFTVEAAGLLRGRGVTILSLKEYPWTDESYENIRASVGARVKRPAR